MASSNAINNLGPVPVQTPVLVNNQNFTRGWIQWFQAVLQAVKTIPVVSSATPASPATIVGYTSFVNSAGKTCYQPYYQ